MKQSEVETLQGERLCSTFAVAKANRHYELAVHLKT